MNNLLARFADSTFWLARHMERAENLARLLDVTETFARDRHGASHWLPIVSLHADEERFAAAHGEADAESVIRFYVLDQENPTSIISSVGYARDNARALRHLISTEMWTQINVFYHRLLAMNVDAPMLPRLSRVCTAIKEQCATHYGITEGTLYRDQTWFFYEIGKMVERADQVTRLLDISYHSPRLEGSERDREVEHSKWNAVLRSAAGYHAFRRVHPRGMDPDAVASFLLFDQSFPRSLAVCIGRIDSLLATLEDAFELRDGGIISEELEDISQHVLINSMENVSRVGLHTYLDSVQSQLVALSDKMGQYFFGHAPRMTSDGS